MSWMDYLLLALIGGYCVYLLLRKKKKDGCCGDCSQCGGADFSDTGGHYNPDAQEHPRHAGDLPPLLSVGGRAFLAVETGRFTPCEVIGRTVVIHGSADDFHTQPSGNAGKKIACGVIRRG